MVFLASSLAIFSFLVSSSTYIEDFSFLRFLLLMALLTREMRARTYLMAPLLFILITELRKTLS